MPELKPQQSAIYDNTKTIRRDAKNGRVLSPWHYPKDEYGLNDRQRKIIEMIAKGLGSKQIADKLHSTFGSLGVERTHLITKMGCRNSAHMVAVSYQKGILKVDSRGTD